jgi:hypothetical protein
MVTAFVQPIFKSSNSLLPTNATSPILFPNSARASGDACGTVYRVGSASSSPTMRNVSSRPSSRAIVTA